MRNRIEEQMFSQIANELSLPHSEVRRAVYSFFGVIVSESRHLPFDDCHKIFTKDKFDEYVKVRNIPSIGRIGPVYSRYLKWRSNESKNHPKAPRSDYRSRIRQSDIETIAADILSGNPPRPLEKRNGKELYDRIWMVGRVGKRLARQVIPKEEKDVQD